MRALMTLHNRLGLDRILAAFLLAVTILKMVYICLHVPIVAYANNYDFLRQSSCVGVWQHYPDHAKEGANPDRAVNLLVYDGDRRRDACLHSSDNLFPWAVAHIHHKNAEMSLRSVGALKALAAVGLLTVIVLQPISRSLRFGLCLAAALIYGDIAILSYFDTLYLEGSLIIFLFTAMALTLVLVCRKVKANWQFVTVLAFVILWLGLSRQQYSSFAFLLGLHCAAFLFWRWRQAGQAACIAAVSLCMVGAVYELSVHQSAHTHRVAMANLTDTFLGTVLPAAKDPIRALNSVDLPASCASSIGKNWYSPGFQTNNPCPAVYLESRLQLIPLFLSDPGTLLIPLWQAVIDSRPAYRNDIGHFERPSDADLPAVRAVMKTSFTTVLAALPAWLYNGILVLSSLFGPIGLLSAWRLAMRRQQPDSAVACLACFGLGGCLVAYALLSSVFGDGTYELARHAVGADIGLAFELAALCVLPKFES